MREWFDNLAQREKIFVAAGAGIVLVAVLWSLLLYPVYAGVERLAVTVESKRVLVGWMQAAAAQIKAGGDVAAGGDVGAQSLVVVIDRSARQAGLGGALSRNQPVGDDGIRVRLEGAPFDAVAGWLAQLQTTFGLGLESASFERAATPGTVNASLILRQPG